MADLPNRRSFIGRAAELARLREALAATIAGRAGRTLIVGGEAGIGKSRLIARFADDLDPTARMLGGACLELTDDALPYAPFVEILRALVRDTPAARLPALLGPGRRELTRLLPELATRVADLMPDADLNRASQARLFELVLGVFERLAVDVALVLVVDDVQWADRSTRDLLGFLSRALRDDPVLLLLAVRTDQAGEAVGNLAFLAELEREDHVERIELQSFDRDEVAELAADLSDEPPTPSAIDRLIARTDGNPFYVEELVRARSGDGAALPPVLRDVLVARVAGVSRDTREVLRAAATLGMRIDDELLAAALGLSPRELASRLREALESGILVQASTIDGSTLGFRHALLREVIASEVFSGERVALHLAFAEALEARIAAGDREVTAVEMARHWDGARQASRALPYMVDAAAGAEGVYAFAEAGRLWARAAIVLEDLPAGTKVAGRDLAAVLISAADCAALIGEPSRAVQFLQGALLQCYADGDHEQVLMLENRQRWHLWWSGERGAATAAVEAALAALPAEPPTIPRARVLAQLAAIRMMAGDLAGSAACARQAIEIGERAGAAVEIALAHGVLGWDTALLGDIDAGIAEYRKGQAIAEAAGSIEGIAIAATNLAALLDRVGRSAAALEAARTGYELTDRYGVARTFGAILLGHAAKAELALGRWDEADRSTSMGLRRGAIDAGAVWLAVNRSRLLIGRGRFDEAGALLERARATDARLGGTDYRTALVAAEAELGVWTGRLADVLDRAEEGLAILATAGSPDPSLAWLAALALRAIADAAAVPTSPRAAGDAGALATRSRLVTAQIEAAVASVAGKPGFSVGERAQALLALVRAESDRVAGRAVPSRWHEVVQHWAALERPFQVGYARLREAEAILGNRGPREEAASALIDAAAMAARLGAEPLRGQIVMLARQARITLPSLEAPTADARGPHDLTARESEVLQLVAAGWTNGQIAAALFITRKTASVHVSNLMGKLGAVNRGEAAALAHRLGMVDGEPSPAGHR